MKKREYIPLMIFYCACAAWLFIRCTPDGVGLTNDSAAYIGGARSLMAGQGYVRIGGDGLPRPITHFPPFYSIMLAIFSRINGTDPLKTANLLNLICSVLNQALFMIILIVLTKSKMILLLGGLTFLCAGPVLQANVFALSESLFTTLFFCVFLLSIRAVKKESRWQWLLIGLLAACLALTRYAGLAAVAAVAVYILAVYTTWRKRIESLLLYSAAFSLPFGYWLLQNNGSSDSPVNRVISLHLPSAEKIKEGIRNFAGFFLPEFGGFVEKNLTLWGWVIAVLLVVLLGAVIYFSLRGILRPSPALSDSALYAPALHGAAYLVVLFITVCFIDGSTLFDNRILLPFYICALLMIDSFCGLCFHMGKWLAITAFLVLSFFNWQLFRDQSYLIDEYSRNGQGMAGVEWKESQTRLAAKELPSDRLLFSNRQTALYLLNNQSAYILPPMYDSASASERENFEKEKAWMDDEVLSGKAFVVVFSYQDMMENKEDRIWLRKVLEGLPVYGEYEDGAIFGLDAARQF